MTKVYKVRGNRIFWLVFVSALLIILVFFIYKNTNQLEKAKPIIVLSAICAICIMIYQYIRFQAGFDNGFGKTIKPQDLGFSLKFGSIGTLIGFLLSLFGAFHLNSTDSKSHDSERKDSLLLHHS
ncbi:MAG: hypothetical protein HQK75_03875 [Candidatus Magnetomorum sp.]|nr:hypothetical protein [Candidatus Magnetomorum sp.]